jgi:hypothetical protein
MSTVVNLLRKTSYGLRCFRKIQWMGLPSYQLWVSVGWYMDVSVSDQLADRITLSVSTEGASRDLRKVNT